MALLTLALHLLGILSSAELLVRDTLLRTLPSRPVTKVAVVLIDEEALKRGGSWPWSREQLARLVDQTFAAGAKGVALDFLLPEPRTGDDRLAQSLAKGPTVLAAGLSENGQWLLPHAGLAPSRIGHVSFDLDQDGVVRRFSALKQSGDRALPALPVAAAQLLDPDLPVPVGKTLRPSFRTRPVPAIGAAAVLEGLAGDHLRGRVVFLGSSAAGVGDRFVSPISPGGSPEPGVFIEALATEAVLTNDLIRIAPPLLDAALALILAGFGLALLASRYRTLPMLTPLLVLAPFPVSGVCLHFLRLETSPLSIALSLLLVGAVVGIQRSRRTRTAMDLAEDRIQALEALQVSISDTQRQEAEARRVVAHELKTPLTSVRGLVQLLSQFDLSREERDRVVGMVATETIRLSQMVDALLDLERLRLRDFEKDSKLLDLSVLCSARTEVLRAGIGRLLEASIESGIEIRGDKALLDRVIENLVSNAVKFSPEGTLVRISLKAAEGHAVLEVVDQGPGIPAVERSAIFGRFARGSNQGLAPGLGLGLALVSEVVAWHHGTVEADEAPGGGSRFRVELPLAVSGQ